MSVLTPEQLNAFNYIDSKKNIFITSRGAGCGKTYLINKIIEKYSDFWDCKNLKNIGITASTGVAAILIKGVTIHSWAGIGIGNRDKESLLKKVKANRRALKRWKSVQMLIIDEISLISSDIFDKLEFIARSIRETEKPFGGIQLILSGDWLQLPNVDNKGYAFESESWDKCIDNVVYLTKIIRQDNPTFQRVLNQIRVGRITREVKKVLRSRVGVKLENEYGIIPTKLYSLNVNVEKINSKHLDILLKKSGRQKKEYLIKWTPKKQKYSNYNNYLKQCRAPESLELCIGAQVMLLINKNNFLVNGSRGIVTAFNSEGLPIVKFLNGIDEVIERVSWEAEVDNITVGSFNQLPLKLAYATTIHKSQGSTLDYVEIDLSKIFEISQGYVGLSRVQDLEKLSIVKLDFHKFMVNRKALEFYVNLEKSIK